MNCAEDKTNVPAKSAVPLAADSPGSLARLKARLLRLLKIVAWVIGIPTFIILAIFLITMLSIWSYSFKDQTRQADAAIVLGAAVYTRTPSPVFAERIRHGIQLYQDGYVKKIIFTGGKDPYDKTSEAHAARAMALKAKIPDEDILIENQSTNTWGNLANSKAIVTEKHFRKLLIVSDPLHMKRATTMARDLELRAFTSPTPTSRYQSLRSQVDFLAMETLYYISYRIQRFFGIEHRT